MLLNKNTKEILIRERSRRLERSLIMLHMVAYVITPMKVLALFIAYRCLSRTNLKTVPGTTTATSDFR